VLVTHAHFDHLDRRTLRKVAANQPIVVPFEVGNLVHDLGFRSVHELGYWESYKLGPLTVTLTPCAHWGARVLHDTHRGFGDSSSNTPGGRFSTAATRRISAGSRRSRSVSLWTWRCCPSVRMTRRAGARST